MEQRILRAAIERDIEWYDRKAHKMKSRDDVLALAVCIGATKALREVLTRMNDPSASSRTE